MKKKNKFMKKYWFWIGVICLVVLLGYIVFPNLTEPVVCQADAKICPDGTAVSRVPPDCEFKACPDIEENRVYCTEEQRQADVCPQIYEPVCGYFDPEQVKCIVTPCASTYPNYCPACLDERVLYWTEGVC